MQDTLVIEKECLLRLLTIWNSKKRKISILGNGVVIDPWALFLKNQRNKKTRNKGKFRKFYDFRVSFTHITISSRNG